MRLWSRNLRGYLYISQAARTRILSGRDKPLDVDRSLYQMEDYIQQVLAFDVRQGAAVRVEKMVTFFTSRDPAISDTLAKARTSALRGWTPRARGSGSSPRSRATSATSKAAPRRRASTWA